MAIQKRAFAAFLQLFLLACGTNHVNVGGVDTDGGNKPIVSPCATPDNCPGIAMTLIPKTSNNPIFDLANQGVKSASLDVFVASGRRVTVSYNTPTQFTVEAQETEVQNAVTMKMNGIIVSCVDDGLSSLINQAVDKGIPVITFDSDCPSSKRFDYYSIKNDDAGAKGADLLVSAMGQGKKTVAILSGREGADNLQKRVDGFKARLASYPDVQVVDTRHCMETGEDCGDVIENGILADHPDLDGLFITGLWGLQAACTCGSDAASSCSCKADQMPNWKKLGGADGRLKTVSFDTLPFQLTLMKQGYVSALISQNYYGWGYYTVKLMFDYLTQGQIDSYDSDFDVVCPNNVDDMASKWQTSNFTVRASPPCDIPMPSSP